MSHPMLDPVTVAGLHSVAHHEAGHALAELMNRVPFIDVTLTVVNPGHVRGEVRPDQRFPYPGPWANLVNLYAGPHAQALHGHHGHDYRDAPLDLPSLADLPADPEDDTDLDKVVRLTTVYKITGHDLREAEQEALDLLHTHHDTLTTLAAALVKRRRLTQLDVLDLLRSR